MSKFDHNKWIKAFKSGKILNEGKFWTLLRTPGNFVTYEPDYADGTTDDVKDAELNLMEEHTKNPATKAAKEYKRKHGVNVMVHVMDEGINEAPQSEFGIEDAPDLQSTLQTYIDEVERVTGEVRDLEQLVAGGIDMYEDETGDLRISQLRNQASRYIQSSEKNLDGLYKALQRAQKGNA